MKKLSMIVAVALAFAACSNENNSGNSAESVQDSVMQTIDSVQEARVDSIQETTDSVKQRLEKTFEQTDSANKANAGGAVAQ